MRDAVLKIRLGCRQLVVAAEDELAVDDVVNGVCTPGRWILNTATRPAAATPLIGEDDLGSLIVEGRRMPVGEPGIDDGVDPLGRSRITDVEDDAVA